MEREVLTGDEKKEGVILAFYPWTITQVFNHIIFWQEKMTCHYTAAPVPSPFNCIRSSLIVAQLFSITIICAVFSHMKYSILQSHSGNLCRETGRCPWFL